MIIIGIDNGVSGSIGFINTTTGTNTFEKVPVKKQLNYTKTKRWITRIDTEELISKFVYFSPTTGNKTPILVYIERPMVNPGRFQATASALRALEATLIVLEKLKLPYKYIDSKEWQKKLLPNGLKGEELKVASLQIGQRLFPQIDFKGFKDADGLLIAEYGRQQNLDERRA